MLEIRDVSHAYGETKVLKHVSLQVRDGEFLSLVGPSGCGKSTLLRILAGLLAQDSGSIAMGGRSIDALSPKDRDIAMVFQNYALYPQLTVAQNIALPLRMRRMSLAQRLPLASRLHDGARRARVAIEAEVTAVAKMLSIEELLGRRPGQLSGGQRQRVALGRALVRKPRAFLMDEPLSNLDAELRVQMRSEIAQLHRRLGATIIYVTHDQVEAMTMSTRVAVMMAGEVLQVAPPDEIYAEPACLRVARFIGSPRLNVFPGESDPSGAIHFAGCRVAGPDGGSAGRAAGPVSIGVRPESMVLASRPAEGLVPLVVSHMENLGPDRLAHLSHGTLPGQWVARLPSDGMRFAPGDQVYLDLGQAPKLLFDRYGRRMDPSASAAAAA